MSDRTKEHPYGRCEKCGATIGIRDDGLMAHGYDRLCSLCYPKMREAEDIAWREAREHEHENGFLALAETIAANPLCCNDDDFDHLHYLIEKARAAKGEA